MPWVCFTFGAIEAELKREQPSLSLRSRRACPERSRRACPERSRRACPERSRRACPERSRRACPERSRRACPERSRRACPERSRRACPERSRRACPERSRRACPERSRGPVLSEPKECGQWMPAPAPFDCVPAPKTAGTPLRRPPLITTFGTAAARARRFGAMPACVTMSGGNGTQMLRSASGIYGGPRAAAPNIFPC